MYSHVVDVLQPDPVRVAQLRLQDRVCQDHPLHKVSIGSEDVIFRLLFPSIHRFCLGINHIVLLDKLRVILINIL